MSLPESEKRNESEPINKKTISVMKLFILNIVTIITALLLTYWGLTTMLALAVKPH